MELLIAMAPQGGEGGSMVSTLIMFGAIFAIFYFMIIRPQQKKQKERDALLSSVKKGDKIITASGIHGSIAGIDEKTVLVDVGNNTKIKMERTAIGQVLSNKEN
ncbi:MAG: preprotein translocase subunit YajC [Ignavibacteriales bacterium]|nr:preprotein translocase subunit YajC [Ignavibacteriales bacterium]MCB9210582.1 preprotein translocase subunit YajC [Ignavibacteriales bacterium]MCB9219957.1 preprotein translocase subunit YajC [Ignavibacteriales bacterium]MCB9259180.1 preprotein translocase subunit YajC [Ignavibacteriales bacterium]